MNKADNSELEVIEQIPLLEWLASNYRRFGCVLEFVTNKSENGSQFCRGFGGIGGILRYQVDLAQLEEDHREDTDSFVDSHHSDDDAWDSDVDFM